MDEARIAELLAPFLADEAQRRDHKARAGASHAAELSPIQLRYISIYIDLLLRWNARINLTAVREPEEIVTRHFGESIFAARRLFPGGHAGTEVHTPHVIDVGSGPGFPGLPIKILAPNARLTLIESNYKKATFLREVVRNLRLTSVEVFAGRANDFTGSTAGVVTIRAVERFGSILPVAAGLMESAGCLAMLIGKAQVRGIIELLPNLKWDKPIKLPLSESRVLILGRKES
jgi:16S rRNA (guanine527-N7)-methyltransferase